MRSDSKLGSICNNKKCLAIKNETNKSWNIYDKTKEDKQAEDNSVY